ncbi:MAG: hypothetical protein WC220_05635 [Pedobacter sp.]|jgi:hypothetical protein
MKRNSFIRFKAFFLLIVFSLSTLVGFACTVGLNMGFNEEHHKTEDHRHPAEAHQGKSHKHENEGHNAKGVTDHHKKLRSHDVQSDHHEKQASKLQKNKADDCCKDEVAKFEKYDKRAPQPLNFNLQAPFVTVISSTLFNIDALASYLHIPSNKFFVRNHHPPITDTRIAIQSFLI